MARSTRNQDAGTAVAEKEPATAPAPSPTYDDIARRAYELYQQRGAADGQEWDDWLRAETELKEGRGRRDDEI